MHTINIIHAEKKHKDFILHANDVINNVNDTEQTNGLRENIDKDYFCDNPKFKCLIAEIDGNPVGMILYSYFTGQMMEKYFGFRKCLLKKNIETKEFLLSL